MSVSQEQIKLLQQRIPSQKRKGPGGKMLDYITSRQVMDLLDEVVGPANWKEEKPSREGKNLYWGISIKIDGEWVTKWDCGAESQIESEKGEASDAFKRAAVKWGIGRFLYPDTPKQSNYKTEPDEPKATEGQKNDILAAAKKMDWTQVMMGDYLKGRGLKWKSLTFEQAKGLKVEVETMLGQLELAALAEQKGMKPHALTATCEKKFAKAPAALTLDEIQQVTKQLAQLEDAA